LEEKRAPPEQKSPARQMLEGLLFALVVSTAVTLLLLCMNAKGG